MGDEPDGGLHGYQGIDEWTKRRIQHRTGARQPLSGRMR
jgi:hypothetical protein